MLPLCIRRVLGAPNIKGKALLVGNRYNESIIKIHPVYSNLDRVAYYRRGVLKAADFNSSMKSVLEWQEENSDFIINASINNKDGHITMQTSRQKQICSTFDGIIQTDAIESMISSPSNTVVCVSSAFVESVNRTVPLCYSILFGKTTFHYAHHFRTLFASMDMTIHRESDIELTVTSSFLHTLSTNKLNTKLNDSAIPPTVTVSESHASLLIPGPTPTHSTVTPFESHPNEILPHRHNTYTQGAQLRWAGMVVDFSAAQHEAFMIEFLAAIRIANPSTMLSTDQLKQIANGK
jgi:hypothetical protein